MASEVKHGNNEMNNKVKNETNRGNREATPARDTHRQRWQLWLVMIVCVAPVICSYLVYYFAPPQARTNYGTLIEPQIALPSLPARTIQGQPFNWQMLKDKFVMVVFAQQACPESCVKQLYHVRQVRATTGESRQRVERVLVMLDGTQPTAEVQQLYEGTHVLQLSPDQVKAYFPLPEGGQLSDHIFIVDHLGHVMMRFPKDADPSKTKKDLAKLLKITAGWVKVKPENTSAGSDHLIPASVPTTSTHLPVPVGAQ